jgi:hypothetical protein
VSRRGPIPAIMIAAAALALVSYLTYTRLLPREESGGEGSALSTVPQMPIAASDSPTSKNDDVTALRREMASLRAELAALRQMPRQVVSASANGDQVVADSASMARAREEAAQWHQARIAAVDSAFRSQSINPRWSADTSALIQNVLSRDDVGHIQADSIECRTDMCRVELHDDRMRHMSNSLPKIAMQLARALPAITPDSIRRPDGSSTLILYLSQHREEMQAR